MNPNQPSWSTYDDLYQYQNTPDILDEFLSPLLFGIPNALPTTNPVYAFTSAPALAPAPAPAPLSAPLPHLTCQWVSQNHPPFICGAPLSPDPKHACSHFRRDHDVRGNDKVVVGCLWHACRAPPMQRGSLIRHILTVHLRLLRWQCEVCGREFSRKGTEHVCNGGQGT